MKFFGTTIKETINAFQSKSGEVNDILSANRSNLSAEADSKTKAIGRIIVSLFLLALATYLLREDNKSQPAMTIIGLVAGYWVK